MTFSSGGSAHVPSSLAQAAASVSTGFGICVSSQFTFDNPFSQRPTARLKWHGIVIDLLRLFAAARAPVHGRRMRWLGRCDVAALWRVCENVARL
jgi:hypothetical protein